MSIDRRQIGCARNRGRMGHSRLASAERRMCAQILSLLDHWQSLVAGLLGASAATAAVVLTLLSERRRGDREARALKVALAAEIRQFALRAYEAHLWLRGRLERSEVISVHQLRDDARFPEAVIYPNVADKIGVLEEHAHEVVIFYGRIELMKDALARLKAQLKPEEMIDRPTAATLVSVLLDVCCEAQNILPAFAGTPRSEHDAEFINKVTQARDIWDRRRAASFSPPPLKPGAWASPASG